MPQDTVFRRAGREHWRAAGHEELVWPCKHLEKQFKRLQKCRLLLKWLEVCFLKLRSSMWFTVKALCSLWKEFKVNDVCRDVTVTVACDDWLLSRHVYPFIIAEYYSPFTMCINCNMFITCFITLLYILYSLKIWTSLRWSKINITTEFAVVITWTVNNYIEELSVYIYIYIYIYI